jgi:hypothetical protein
MTSTLVVGVLAAFVATTLAAALRRAPTHTRCPECGGSTVAVRPEAWLLKRMPDIRLRWCQKCSWQGWGRHGAEWIPGHPAAHDSGFFWGEDRLPEDFGFRFADQPPTETSAEPPHHPSGFRFSTPPAGPRKAHPSGFSWADGDGEATGASDGPAGFRWAPPPSEGGGRFAWGQQEGRRGPPPRKGFNWKDVG